MNGIRAPCWHLSVMADMCDRTTSREVVVLRVLTKSHRPYHVALVLFFIFSLHSLRPRGFELGHIVP